MNTVKKGNLLQLNESGLKKDLNWLIENDFLEKEIYQNEEVSFLNPHPVEKDIKSKVLASYPVNINTKHVEAIGKIFSFLKEENYITARM